MYQVRVSQRYGQLFVSTVFEKDTFGEKQVFPQCGLPLVFRTDASARNVAKCYVECVTTKKYQGVDFVLKVDGISVCHGKKVLLDMITAYWGKQSMHIGAVSIEQEVESPELVDSAISAPILQAIYNQCL